MKAESGKHLIVNSPFGYVKDTENFKTTSKNYRSKKRVPSAKENRKQFEAILVKREKEKPMPSV